MANNFPAELRALIASGWARRALYLDIILSDGTQLFLSDESFFFAVSTGGGLGLPAEGGVELGGGGLGLVEEYVSAHLTASGPTVSESQANPRVDLTAQNLDGALGSIILEPEDALSGAWAHYGKVLCSIRDPEGFSGPSAWKICRLSGKLTGANAAEDKIKMQLIGMIEAAGTVAATQQIQRNCRFKYKGLQCSSASTRPSCLHTWVDCALHDAAPVLIHPVPAPEKGNRDRYGGDGLYVPEVSLVNPADPETPIHVPVNPRTGRPFFSDVDGPTPWRNPRFDTPMLSF